MTESIVSQDLQKQKEVSDLSNNVQDVEATSELRQVSFDRVKPLES